MAQYDLGKVSIRPRGAYAANTNYEFLDSVQNLGGSWLALAASKDVQPGVTAGWQSYWMMITRGIKTIVGSSPADGQTKITITFTDDTTASFTYNNEVLADGSVTYQKLASDAVKLQFLNTAIATASFVSNSTYQDYPYRASVGLTGVLASMTPEIIFSLADATSGNFAPVAECYNGGIYLYAASAPDAAVTIPTIICWR